ncbi:hypothetical protein EZI54_06150 [Marinobacter halodurans]|uniref:J domain-containing protein n=1 Tax=Marinobacter halodurans TaxID=2528979 RepID=A0ABY1ZPX8_9GAMM|nr:hypothetical protein EZI54_06150 [Marinobacter halodurans]
MNAWEILGIEPGSDRRAIKKAYARLARDCHPEERPEAFMELRQAYEVALEQLAGAEPGIMEVPPAGVEPMPVYPSESEPVPEWEPEYEDGAQTNDHVSASPVFDSRAVETLCDDLASFVRRPLDEQSPEELEAILGHPLLEHMEVRDWVGLRLLTPFCVEIHEASFKQCPFSRNTLLALDRVFHWSANYQMMPGLPVDDFHVLLDGAYESQHSANQRYGWKWLANLLLGFKGSITRREWLLGFVCMILWVITTLNILQGIINLVPPQPYHSLLFLGVGLVGLYSFICLTIKRAVDAGVNRLGALIMATLFPFVIPLYIVGAPQQRADVPDPRLQFMDHLDLAYWDVRDQLPQSGFMQKVKQFYRRLSGRVFGKLGIVFVVGLALTPWVN